MQKVIIKVVVPMLGLALASTAFAQAGAKAAQAAPTASLKVGSPAPPLVIKKWVKGTPVTTLGHGNVNVVEFWATWCGPCRESIPHLTELAHKYKGKATFTGVSVFEVPSPHDESYMPKVASFVKEMGDKMDYNVGADGMSGVMGKTWMEAAGQDGIPTAFVIDQKGAIAWIGHPMMGLDEVVGKVIDGTFNPKDEEARVAKEKADQANLQQELMPLMEAVNAKKFDVAIKEIDKISAKHPEMAAKLAIGKFSLLLQSNETAAYAFGRDLINAPKKPEPEMLNDMAMMILRPESPLKHPNYGLAVAIAKTSVDATKGKDPLSLDIYAQTLYKVGEADMALAVEKKALLLTTPDSDPEMLAVLKNHMALYKSKK